MTQAVLRADWDLPHLGVPYCVHPIPEPLAWGAVAGVRDTLVLGVTSAAWPCWDITFQHDPGENKGWMLSLPTHLLMLQDDAALLGRCCRRKPPATSCCHHCTLKCHKETGGDGSREEYLFIL